MCLKTSLKLIMRIREISRAGTRNKMDDKTKGLLICRVEYFVVKYQYRKNVGVDNLGINNKIYVSEESLVYRIIAYDDRHLFCDILTVLYDMDSYDGWQFNSRWRLLNGNLILLRVLSMVRGIVVVFSLILWPNQEYHGYKACAHLDIAFQRQKFDGFLSFYCYDGILLHRLKCQPCAFDYTIQRCGSADE